MRAFDDSWPPLEKLNLVGIPASAAATAAVYEAHANLEDRESGSEHEQSGSEEESEEEDDEGEDEAEEEDGEGI